MEATKAPTERVFAITFHKLDELRKSADRLNRKAKRLGLDVEEIVVESHGVKSKRIQIPEEGIDLLINLYDVTISGESPVLHGWKFIASIEHMIGGSNLVKTISDDPIPLKYWSVDPICEHCNLQRKRKDTYLLQSVTDPSQFKQVGRSCLKDFTGHPSPESLADWATSIAGMLPADDEDDWDLRDLDFTQRTDVYADLKDALKAASAAIRLFGYVKTSEYGINRVPTRDVVIEYCFTPASKRSGYLLELADAIDDTDEAQAQAAIDWINEEITHSEETGTTDNSFLQNLKVLTDAGCCSSRGMGFVAGMMISFIKQRDKKAETKEEFKDEHFGVIGYRGTYRLKVLFQKDIETRFGMSTLIKMIDEENRAAVWFTSAHVELEDGEWYTLKCTVKKHDTYNGIAQTNLSRCRVQ